MQVRMVPIDDVKPYPGNPRKPRNAVAKVKASLAEFGWQQPLVVDRNMVLIVGHTRHQAARALKMKEVPVVEAASLTEAQARAYRIADNRTGAEAEFDVDLLRVELEGLQSLEANMAALGFDPVELEGLMAAPQTDGNGRDPGLGDPVISYQLVFSDEAQQTLWFDFLRHLKREMPDEDTIGARLARFLREGGYGARP